MVEAEDGEGPGTWGLQVARARNARLEEFEGSLGETTFQSGPCGVAQRPERSAVGVLRAALIKPLPAMREEVMHAAVWIAGKVQKREIGVRGARRMPPAGQAGMRQHRD